MVVGAHSCILPGCDIPDGVAFGAYTLVKEDSHILSYHLYAGHKCRDLGEREGKELLENLK